MNAWVPNRNRDTILTLNSSAVVYSIKCIILCLSHKTQDATAGFLYCLKGIKWKMNSWLTCSSLLKTEDTIIHKYAFHNHFHKLVMHSLEIQQYIFWLAATIVTVIQNLTIILRILIFSTRTYLWSCLYPNVFVLPWPCEFSTWDVLFILLRY